MTKVHRITGKDFIAAVAAQRHRHMLASKSREQISRNQRRVAKRLVHPGADFADQVCGEAGAESLLMMIGAEKLGDRTRILRFVE